MRRREFTVTLLCLAATTSVAAAQTRVAVVHTSHPLTNLSETSPVVLYREFFKRLRELGYEEGSNLVVDRYTAQGDPSRYTEISREVVSKAPAVVFATRQFVNALRAESPHLPLVILTIDPLSFGVTAALSGGRGKMTGISVDAGLEIWGKRVEIITEIMPSARKIGFLVPETGQEPIYRRELERLGSVLGITIVSAALTPPFDKAGYERAFVMLEQDGVQSLLIQDGSINISNRRTIISLAERAKLPTLYPFREYVTEGGLIAYAVDLGEQGRRAASQVVEILKGADPDDIPFSQVSRFNLIVNLQTAKSLNLTIPPTLLARANEVIE